MAERKATKKDLRAQLEERRGAIRAALEREVKTYNEVSEIRNNSIQSLQELNARLKEVNELLQANPS